MPIDFKTIESRFSPTNDGKCAFSANGIITTQSAPASQVGADIMRAGGNAVDAAASAALALGVTEPQASGLGGQTMMLIRLQDKVIAVDGSSRAPSLAHVSAVYKRDRSTGYRATTVPSTLATLWYVHQRYGQLPWQQIVEPAITLAKSGFLVTELQHNLLVRERENFAKVESGSGTKYFYKNGAAYQPGELFKQADLANTLARIAKGGAHEFYRGAIAQQIDADMRENGGLLRMDDLALIPFPIEREPIVGAFRELDIYTMPPPGSGRSFLFALMMLDLVPNNVEMDDPLKEYLLFIHILRKTLLERSDRPYDPNFFPQSQHEEDMLDPLYARECLLDILADVDRSVLPFVPTEDELAGETTHLSVIDKNGIAVSLTQSIERVFGSKAAAAGLGFLYNNYLYDFEYALPEHPFYLRPNAVPWATVAPSLVFHNDDLWLVLGSPGSERIVSTLARFLLNIVDNRMSLSEAMLAPRLHCSLGGRVSLEAGRFPESLLPFLEYKNFRIDKREDFSFYLGCVQAVLKQQDGGLQGVADVRRDVTVIGV